MGKGNSLGSTVATPKVKRQPICSICRKVPTTDCDWRQGRCPHLPPMVGVGNVIATARARLKNLLKIFGA